MKTSQFKTEKDLVVMAAVGNAFDTFRETGRTMTLDEFVRVAVASIWDCLEANRLDMTPRQILQCEVAAADHARSTFPVAVLQRIVSATPGSYEAEIARRGLD